MSTTPPTIQVQQLRSLKFQFFFFSFDIAIIYLHRSNFTFMPNQKLKKNIKYNFTSSSQQKWNSFRLWITLKVKPICTWHFVRPYKESSSSNKKKYRRALWVLIFFLILFKWWRSDGQNRFAARLTANEASCDKSK